MMVTKKTAKKTAKATTAPNASEPTTEVLLPMTAEWAGPSAWKSKSLGWCLTNASIVDDEKLADVMSDEDSLIEDVADAWLRDRLKDAERAQVAEFVRVISWLDHVAGAGATRAQLTLPDCLLPIITEALNTTEKLQKEFFEQVIVTPADQISEIVQKTAEVVEAIVEEALTPPKADADGQLQLVQEPVAPKKPLTPLTFQSGEQVASVRLALQARADDLKAEAKRLSGLGRTVEAAALEREAKDISEQLLRQVQSQTAIPFNENETLPQAIKRVVQGEIRHRARTALLKSVAIKKGETKQDADARALAKLDDLEALIGNVGEQAGLLVCDLIVEAADRAKEAGKHERLSTASAIAREAVQAVEARKVSERDAA